MINDLELKKLVLLDNDNDSAKIYEKIYEMKLNLIELAREELNLIELKNLSIFD
ncbi:MAG TPA: hypothetical protein VN704_11370 [Verrucomicrobiae bacterium]|nr:hypothetical protein [Verrucomicrobiae bacterium]